MTQQEKRIKIAESCGWKYFGPIFEVVYGYPPNPRKIGVTVVPDPIPDYFSSLDACHEMEKHVRGYPKETGTYGLKLSDIVIRDAMQDSTLPFNDQMATATQRAEAFGITMGLWKEGE